ncbi:unnamed protein product [Oikopleura dioica]|uniref:rhomboid protease n=1 Tax=Oikopleura dioica TaxID=34765 RepID=E4YZD2_OIKDI|nr:unnamed protein product [Oikopleura dioica]
MSLKYVNQSLGQVSYAAHLGGAFVGLTFGFLTLKNFKRKPWEDCIWRICIILFAAVTLVLIAWNCIYPELSIINEENQRKALNELRNLYDEKTELLFDGN